MYFLEAKEDEDPHRLPNKSLRVNLESTKFQGVELGVEACWNLENQSAPSAATQSPKSKEWLDRLAKEVRSDMAAKVTIKTNDKATIGEGGKQESKAEEICDKAAGGEKDKQVSKAAGSDENTAGGSKGKCESQKASKIVAISAGRQPAKSATVKASRTARNKATKTSKALDQDGLEIRDEEPVVDAKWKPPRSKVPESSKSVGENDLQMTVKHKGDATSRGGRKRKVEVVFEAEKEYRMVSPSDTHKTAGYGIVVIEAIESGEFHGLQIPRGFIVVHLKKVTMPTLLLPYPNMKDDPPHTMLGDALGTGVLWPAKCVKSTETKKKR